MVSQPIETVRGEHLKPPPTAIAPAPMQLPALTGRPAVAMTLAQQPRGPVWLIEYQDGDRRRADARTGALLPSLNAAEAAMIARTAYAGSARLMQMRRFGVEAVPLDLRRPRPSWQARFTDGTHVYVDAETGAVLALRTRWWRVYDWMWGLHIMDLQTREDTSHPVLIGAAALALVVVVLGLVMLPLRRAKGQRRAAGARGIPPARQGSSE